MSNQVIIIKIITKIAECGQQMALGGRWINSLMPSNELIFQLPGGRWRGHGMKRRKK